MEPFFNNLGIPGEDLLVNKDCVFTGDNYRISVLTDRLVRLEYSENGVFYDNATELVHFRNMPKPEFTQTEDDKYLVITTKYFQLQYHKGFSFAGPRIAPDTNLKIILSNTEKVYYFNHPEARNFFGSSRNLSEKIKKGLYSTDGFATLNDGESMLLDENGYFLPDTPKRIDTYVFMYRKDFGLALKDYYRLTGVPPLIPRYALGVWWNRDMPYSFFDTKELLKAFNKHRIPLSVLLLGNDWHIRNQKNPNILKTGYLFNQKLFPNPSELFTYMHDRGVRVGLNINPTEGIMPHETNYKQFKEAIGDNVNQVIPFNALNKTFIDAYFYYMIKPLHDLGCDFFWLDYENKDFVINRILNYYHFNYYKSMESKRGLILANNTTIAGHLYPVHYSGRTTVSWKVLKDLPYYNATSSNIGLSWWSHDIGGYEGGSEDNELYTRYVQLGCFSPILRFSAKKGHYYKREPWRWDSNTYEIVKNYLTLRHRLIPYIYSEAYRYYHIGLPLCEPIYYVYPEIYDEISYRNEYYFGSSMFVSPITKPMDRIMNRSVERIYLPEGVWYDFKTGKRYQGDKRYVTFQNNEDYPVFVKSGGIIPLAVLGDNLNDTGIPSTMEFHIFPGQNNTYDLYEDDGISSLFEEGYYTITSIDYNYMPNNYTVTIRPIEGKNGIVPEKRNYIIRFRNVRQADDVTAFISNQEIPVETYEDENDFIVEIKDVSTASQLTVNCKGSDIEIDAVRLINEEIDLIISDLKISTDLKEEISYIIFNDEEMRKKRIKIRKLRNKGLDPVFIKMFIKLLEYVDNL